MRSSRKVCLNTNNSFLNSLQELTIRKSISPFNNNNKQNFFFSNNIKNQIDNSNQLKSGVNQVFIINERLVKQNQILQMQINQKQNIIRALKQQLDNSVLMQTKYKLDNARFLQEKFQKQLEQWKKQFQQRLAKQSDENEQLSIENAKLREQLTRFSNLQNNFIEDQNLKFQAQITKIMNKHAVEINTLQSTNRKLHSQTRILKQQLVEIIEQKQRIIRDLQYMLNEKIIELSNMSKQVRCQTRSEMKDSHISKRTEIVNENSKNKENERNRSQIRRNR